MTKLKCGQYHLTFLWKEKEKFKLLNANTFCVSAKIPWMNYISWSFINTLCFLLIHSLFPSILPTLTAVLKIY